MSKISSFSTWRNSGNCRYATLYQAVAKYLCRRQSPRYRRSKAMSTYVGLDVSLKDTSVCVVDEDGRIVKEGIVASGPTEDRGLCQPTRGQCAPRRFWSRDRHRTGCGARLARRDLPMICIDARHAKATLSMQINKSDRNDAAGIARIMQVGWYREVAIKSPRSQSIRGLLGSRALLVKIKRDLENQIRGSLKTLGHVIGRAKGDVFSGRADAILASEPSLADYVRPLMDARESVRQQLAKLDHQVKVIVGEDQQARGLMTAPASGQSPHWRS